MFSHCLLLLTLLVNTTSYMLQLSQGVEYVASTLKNLTKTGRSTRTARDTCELLLKAAGAQAVMGTINLSVRKR